MEQQNNTENVETAKEMQDNQNNTGNVESNHIPKERLDREISKRKEMEDAMQSIAEDLIADIPSDFQSIIPDLPIAEKIKWIRTAEKKGLFGHVDVGNSPDSNMTSSNKPVDYSNMSTMNKMQYGYNK